MTEKDERERDRERDRGRDIEHFDRLLNEQQTEDMVACYHMATNIQTPMGDKMCFYHVSNKHS